MIQMDARTIPRGDVDDELEQLVAQVRGRGAGEVLPRPSPEALAALAAHLREEEPMSAKELAEHERLWRAVEEEMRAVERANDAQEGTTPSLPPPRTPTSKTSAPTSSLPTPSRSTWSSTSPSSPRAASVCSLPWTLSLS
jgi:hypothetical protein